jgi:hypothetical protein
MMLDLLIWWKNLTRASGWKKWSVFLAFSVPAHHLAPTLILELISFAMLMQITQ